MARDARSFGLGSVVRDRWRIDGRLGAGATAVIWSAVHRNGDRVAIKVLKPELAAQESLRRRFVREAYVANGIGHPATVRVIDDDVAPDGTPFIVMDRLEGKTLEQRREEAGGRLPPEEVVRRMLELLDLLSVAHAKRIVHRDLKPDNCFIDGFDRLRVLDFGIARVLDETSTQQGALLGTPEFMAPEQAEGRPEAIDARTDLWAVGSMTFYLITGEPVFNGASLLDTLNAILSRPARSLRQVAPSIEPRLAAVVDRALRRDRDGRWQTANEMRRAFLDAGGPTVALASEEIGPRTVAFASEQTGPRTMAPASEQTRRWTPGSDDDHTATRRMEPSEPLVVPPLSRTLPLSARRDHHHLAPPSAMSPPLSSRVANGARPRSHHPATWAVLGVAAIVFVVAGALLWKLQGH